MSQKKKEEHGSTIATTATGQGLSERAQDYFRERGLEPKTMTDLGVYTNEQGCLVYPIGTYNKYVAKTTEGKRQWQDEGVQSSQRTFFNAQGIEYAIRENQPLIITEGEDDCAVLYQLGYQNVVSMPGGAPQSYNDDPIDPQNDSARYHPIWNHFEDLIKVKSFILCGDNDQCGEWLNHDLQRRLGPERCQYIDFPEGSKDIRDILLNEGEEDVCKAIENPNDWPIHGLLSIDDVPDTVEPVYMTGLPFHDEHIKLMLGKFMVVTGYAGGGKSEWIDNVIFNLSMKENFHNLVCTFEIGVSEYKANFRKKYKSEKIGGASDEECDEFMRNHYRFISNDVMDEDFAIDIEKIIELAQISVVKYGTKVLVIDPWNEVEHQRKNNESQTEYIGRAIRQLKRLARRFNILVCVLAHPAKPKMEGKEGPRIPSMYDISDSANWANKADYGIVVHRPDAEDNRCDVYFRKIKRHGIMGKPGSVSMRFYQQTGTYSHV